MKIKKALDKQQLKLISGGRNQMPRDNFDYNGDSHYRCAVCGKDSTFTSDEYFTGECRHCGSRKIYSI